MSFGLSHRWPSFHFATGGVGEAFEELNGPAFEVGLMRGFMGSWWAMDGVGFLLNLLSTLYFNWDAPEGSD